MINDYSPPFHLTDEIAKLSIEIGELIGMVSVGAGLSPDPRLKYCWKLFSIKQRIH